MSHNKYTAVAEALKAIAHPARLKIIEVLRDGALTVSQIQARLHSKQAITSQHLSSMKSKGVLESHREGMNVYYAIRNKEILKILQCVSRCVKR